MKTEEEIVNEIKRLQKINTTLPNGSTNVFLEFKRATSIAALLYVIGKIKNLNIEGVRDVEMEGMYE